jgi:uncharacterized protein YaaN involved in tellurite resistance
MAREISLDRTAERMTEGEGGLFRNLEEKVERLLQRYQTLKEERDGLAAALQAEKEKVLLLEKKLELLSDDREKVKTRIDHLLVRLKGIDF